MEEEYESGYPGGKFQNPIPACNKSPAKRDATGL